MHINVLLSFNWSTVLSIILFFVALGVLVTIHEFGHFIAAKSFKVYCSDFSIGFGPKIVKIKRKKGETTFSIGILPLGGYVSMLGEDDEESMPEGVQVPKERTLIGIARYKRIIIMAAGITMNFILAYLIFFVSASCFPQVVVNSWYTVGEDSQIVSATENIEFENNDQLVPTTFYYRNGQFYKESEIDNPSPSEALNILNEGYITLENGNNETKYIATLSYSLAGGVNNTDLSKNIILYETDGTLKIGNTNYYAPVFENGQPVKYVNNVGDKFIVSAKFANALDNELQVTSQDQTIEYERDSEGNLVLSNCEIFLTSNDYGFDPLNVSFYKYDLWYGVKAFQVAGEDWVQSTSLIGQALVNLFVGQGWDQLGGPLAIFSQTTEILQNNPFYTYLNTWGTISVNLALFNLLPFPGLDGWQILVELVEGSVNGIRKAKFKANKKRKDEEEAEKAKRLEINSHTEQVATTVTANKDVNLTIGKGERIEDKFVEWQVPPKVKTIMSYIGLGLLLLLMIFVFVKDIFTVF